MLLDLERICVPPGQKVLLEKITWQEFETILDELGEHRAARIAYDNGILEIIASLNRSINFVSRFGGKIPK